MAIYIVTEVIADSVWKGTPEHYGAEGLVFATDNKSIIKLINPYLIKGEQNCFYLDYIIPLKSPQFPIDPEERLCIYGARIRRLFK